MEHYILASHGSLAYGMKRAVEMICGENEKLSSYDLDHYDTPEEIYYQLEVAIQKNLEDSYIIFTDLLGGSIHNCLLGLGRYENTVIIAGMHLGLVLSLITEESDLPLQQRADEAIRMTTPVITAFTKKKILENLSHGEEDEL
ncbi:MAG: hypothetical protein J6I64_08730 [Lachnospiraceae bacterium]|nr:hypothetical protein [Lachnospiraceae bacterium]